MSKPKYSSEFKIMVAEAYLNGEGGFQCISNKYGVGVASVQLWVRCYQHHGKSGFMKKPGNASYSSDFKRECVEAVVIEGFSVNEIIAKYDIPSRSVLQRWIQVYNANREPKDYKPIRGIYMAGRKTSFEERKEIVEYCISHNQDYKGAADRFDVSYYLGYRRMTSWINHFHHTGYSKNRVHRIMKKLGIHSVIRKKKKKYQSYKPETIAGNKLGRDFHAARPNEKWATDVTEFKIPETGKKLYLSAIFDLYDRFPVAYVVSGRNDNKLVFDTYDKALKGNPDAKPIFHSDRGYQYTSRVFRDMLQKQGMEQFMSRVGHCIDNGPTEGLWGIIKSEMYCMYKITDEKSLRCAIDGYMKFYVEERPQKRFLCQTPLEVRRAALLAENLVPYTIAENKRIYAYKAKWCA